MGLNGDAGGSQRRQISLDRGGVFVTQAVETEGKARAAAGQFKEYFADETRLLRTAHRVGLGPGDDRRAVLGRREWHGRTGALRGHWGTGPDDRGSGVMPLA